jgi:uncharacterized protein (UPF0210 family)
MRPVLGMATAIVAAILLFTGVEAPPAHAQQTAAAQEAKPKIRAITAFLNLDRSQYEQQVADAFALLKRARTTFESRGFEVQTIRIATQPFPEYTKDLSAAQAVAFFLKLDALAEKNKFILAIGPAMPNAGDSEAQADLLAAVLRGTKNISGSLVVAGEDGVRWPAVGAAARVIKKLEDTPRSEGNFRFAAVAMVPPMSPFFPAAYNEGFGHQFAVGLESANVVEAAFRGAPDLAAARQRLTDMLGTQAFDVQHVAERVDMETGWRFAGIDLSPAPGKSASIGAAMEELTQQPFGSSGTLTAAATITAAIKALGVKQTGYSGLMLPVLEDPRLAQRWSEGRIAVDALLAYSAVCATGLDTVPLPGDVTEEQLDLMIGDMASLAFKWHKPLTARLLPVAGKQAGDLTAFTDPTLVNVTLQVLK